MRKCIAHGAEISRHVDFHGFLSDKLEMRDEIFADCDRLPSLESNNLQEHIMTQFIHFQYGFEREKECISDNIYKFLNATA